MNQFKLNVQVFDTNSIYTPILNGDMATPVSKKRAHKKKAKDNQDANPVSPPPPTPPAPSGDDDKPRKRRKLHKQCELDIKAPYKGVVPKGMENTIIPHTQTYLVPPHMIDDAAENPLTRVHGAIAHRHLQWLSKSMTQFGQLCPIVVFLKREKKVGERGCFQLTEGHRRKYAAMLNEWSHIHCILIDTDQKGIDLLRTINDNFKPHTNAEKFWTYIVDGVGDGRSKACRYAKMRWVMGLILSLRLIAVGKASHAFNTACKFAAVVGERDKDDNQFENLKSHRYIRKLIRSIIDHKDQKAESILRRVNDGKLADTIGVQLAIEKNRPYCE